MIQFLQQYAAEFIACLAVLASVIANSRAERANRRAARAQEQSEIAAKAARRTEMLVEIERKNAVVAKLAFITTQRIPSLQENPSIAAQ